MLNLGSSHTGLHKSAVTFWHRASALSFSFQLRHAQCQFASMPFGKKHQMIHFNTSCREFAFLSSPMPFGKKSQEDCNYDLTHRLTAFLPSPVPFGKNYLVNPISNPSATAPVPVIASAFRQEAPSRSRFTSMNFSRSSCHRQCLSARSTAFL